MSKAPEAAITQFAQLAKDLAGGDETQLPHRPGMGTGSLFVGKKMFAVLSDSGALVLKLAPARVQELITKGFGAPWHPGTGTPLKEYAAVAFEHKALWLELATESREYMEKKK